MQSLLSGKDNQSWEYKLESIKIYEALIEDNQAIIDSELKIFKQKSNKKIL